MNLVRWQHVSDPFDGILCPAPSCCREENINERHITDTCVYDEVADLGPLGLNEGEEITWRSASREFSRPGPHPKKTDGVGQS